MAMKDWIAANTTPYNTASAWSPSGVPGVADDARFQSFNGNCTFPASTSFYINHFNIHTAYSGTVSGGNTSRLYIHGNYSNPKNYSGFNVIRHLVGTTDQTYSIPNQTAATDYLVLDKETGNVTIELSTSTTVSNIRLNIQGKAPAINMTGRGTVRLSGDIHTDKLTHADTIIIDTNGFTIFDDTEPEPPEPPEPEPKPPQPPQPDIEGGLTSLSNSSLPVDQNNIPIFKATFPAGIPFFTLPEIANIQFDETGYPLVHVTTGTTSITNFSNNLPISKEGTVVAHNSNTSAIIKKYTGNLTVPLNDNFAMVAAIDTSPAILDRYVAFDNMSYPLNENNIPIIKVI